MRRGMWTGDAEQQEEGGGTGPVHLTQAQKTTALSRYSEWRGSLGPGSSTSKGKDAQNRAEEGRDERRGEIKLDVSGCTFT